LLPAVNISKSRGIALEVLHRVRSGKFAEAALSDVLDKTTLQLKDRALATELVYGVLRWQDRLDSIVRKCLSRPGKKIDPIIAEILRLAVYQLFLLDKVPDHAAVDQAVSQAHESDKHAASFVNAVLRRAVKERSTIDTPPDNSAKRLGLYYSHPAWLVRRWLGKYGVNRTTEILKHNNSRTSLELRVNRLKAETPQLISLFTGQGFHVKTVDRMSDALELAAAGGGVDALPGFADGLFLVQGLASQMIAPLLEPKPGERILDACAAPGGKTAHIAALTGDKARIVAVDANPERLRQTADNLRRLCVRSVELIHGDASDPALIENLGTFDKILVDAPCTNLGVLRHNPEAKYRITQETLSSMAKQQTRLLENTASALKPKGILVYSVCSFSEEETDNVIEDFLNTHPGFMASPFTPQDVISEDFLDARGFFATLPSSLHFPIDGFFAARLCRN
jgi:16S rRNA (cytosine967-C5)-methyltransferase